MRVANQLEKKGKNLTQSAGEQLIDQLQAIAEGLTATNCRISFMHAGPTSRLVFRCERSASAQLYSLLSSQGVVVDQLDRSELTPYLDVWRTREGIRLQKAEAIQLNSIITEIQANGTKPNNR
jgi:hypothetical protein